MSEKTVKRIRFISALVMSALAVIAGLLFICSAIAIYQSGDQPYTPVSIAEKFRKIAIPAALFVIWAVGGGILSIALPLPEKRIKGEADPAVTLLRISQRVDMHSLPAQLAQGAAHERKKRKLLLICTVFLYVISSAAALVYLFLPGSFASDDFNRDILKATLTVSACMALPFAASVVYVFIARKSMQKEIRYLKQALAAQKTSPAPVQNEVSGAAAWFKKNSSVMLTAARCSLLLIGAVLVLLGVFNGGADDVLGKAIKICTECIGLG